MKIFVFGSSLTSSYWNGAATYYRGIYKNLYRLGHNITFAEPDIYKRQQHQDAGKIEYATVRVYQTPRDLDRTLAEASEADLIIKHSGVGADDEWLEAAVLRCRSGKIKVAFWDVDAPATLARLQQNSSDSFRELIPLYDFIFTYGGGSPVVKQYRSLGAKNCFPIYNGLDPDTHYPVAPDENLVCDMAFVGHRLPDREHRVNEFFFAAAELAPELSFVLGGEGWGGRPLPSNARWIGHVSSTDHNRINCSARTVLNINRQSMADVGFSPPTRVFEAAGAGACVITDAWAGIDQFFIPKKEILVASSAHEVCDYLREIPAQKAREIGAAMRTRALLDHTYNLRGIEFQEAFRMVSAEIPPDTVSPAHSHV
jgi:spore maturation protein CgeB